MAKLYASEVAMRAAVKGVQIHGGYGTSASTGGAPLPRRENNGDLRGNLRDPAAGHLGRPSEGIDRMEFRLTDEQLQVEEMVRGLSRKEFAPRAAQVDEESRYPAENHRRLAGLVCSGCSTGFLRRIGGGARLLRHRPEEVAAACASTGVGMAVTNMTARRSSGSAATRRGSGICLCSRREGRRCVRAHRARCRSDAGGLSTYAREDGDGSFSRIEGFHHERRPRLRRDRDGADPEVATEDQRIPGGAGVSRFSVGRASTRWAQGVRHRLLSFEECRVPNRRCWAFPERG